MMFGPETILFLGSLSNFNVVKGLGMCRPGVFDPIRPTKDQGGRVKGRLKGRGGSKSVPRGALYNRSQATRCLVYVKLKIHFI